MLHLLPCRNLLQAVDKAAAARQEVLETELHSSKSNLIKESVRMGYDDLGDFFYHKGDLQVGERDMP